MLQIRFARTTDRDAILDLLQEHAIDQSGWRLPLTWWLEQLRGPWAAPADPTALPPDEATLFVVSSGGGIVAVGTFTPAFGTRKAYPVWRLGRTVHASEDLGVLHAVQTLQLGHDVHGMSALEILAALPDLAVGTAPAALLESALRHLRAEAKPPATGQVFVRLRGVHAADGSSAFWQTLGRPFCPPALSGLDASGLDQPHWKAGVAELLPRLPVYAAFLPQRAQSEIGQADHALAGFQQGLVRLGLRESGLVDLIDAGPVHVARWHELAV
jgi:arginine/ornithine succinyltransferase subunit-like protein